MRRPILHRASSRFWQAYRALPMETRTLAKQCFDLLKADPSHPSLRFKKASGLWSARVGINHRALAYEDEIGVVWVWIGTHAEYDLLLRRHGA